MIEYDETIMISLYDIFKDESLYGKFITINKHKARN